MTALVAYFEKPNKRRAEAVDKIEGQADEIRRILIDELNRTFVTPFDREDIHALSRAIDDMLDYAYTTVVEMDILDVSPTEHMHEIGTLLQKSAYEIIPASPKGTPCAPNRWRTRSKAFTARR